MNLASGTPAVVVRTDFDFLRLVEVLEGIDMWNMRQAEDFPHVASAKVVIPSATIGLGLSRVGQGRKRALSTGHVESLINSNIMVLGQPI